MTVILSVEDLFIEGQTSGREWTPIVKGVGFKLKKSQVVALIGESGAGKSTIALSTMGYAKHGCRIRRGRIMLGDSDIFSMDEASLRSLRGNRISYVAQSAGASFNPALRLIQQVSESIILHNLMTKQEVYKKAIELFQLLDLPDPENIGHRYPHQISGGQLQRVMIAMAMICEPEVLLLDEPTTALDVTTQVEVLKAVKDIIKKNQTSAIYVSHDLSVVSQVADRIVVLRYGEIIEQGKTEDIIHHPKADYTKLLMKAVRQLPSFEATGNHSSEPDSQEPEQQFVVEVNNVSATYERRTWWNNDKPKNIVLRDVSISVPPAKTVAVVGESGCGKSTLSRVMAGLLVPFKGQILYRGHITLAPSLKNRSREELRQIQMVFQDPDSTLNPKHQIKEIIGRSLQFYLNLNATERHERIKKLLTWVELPPTYASRYPGELSGGERQRVSLARALAAEPDIILCDEVISALDTVVGSAILKLFQRLQDRLGISYLFISHDLATVASIADYVIVFYAGEIVEQGPMNRVFTPPYHPYTRLLLASVPALRQGWLEEVLQTQIARSGIGRFFGNAISGCAFANRCSLITPGLCDHQRPPRRELLNKHTILCHQEIEALI